MTPEIRALVKSLLETGNELHITEKHLYELELREKDLQCALNNALYKEIGNNVRFPMIDVENQAVISESNGTVKAVKVPLF